MDILALLTLTKGEVSRAVSASAACSSLLASISTQLNLLTSLFRDETDAADDNVVRRLTNVLDVIQEEVRAMTPGRPSLLNTIAVLSCNLIGRGDVLRAQRLRSVENDLTIIIMLLTTVFTQRNAQNTRVLSSHIDGLARQDHREFWRRWIGQDTFIPRDSFTCIIYNAVRTRLSMSVYERVSKLIANNQDIVTPQAFSDALSGDGTIVEQLRQMLYRYAKSTHFAGMLGQVTSMCSRQRLSAVAAVDGNVVVFDDMQIILNLILPYSHAISMCISTDPSVIYCATPEENLFVFDIETGIQICNETVGGVVADMCISFNRLVVLMTPQRYPRLLAGQFWAEGGGSLILDQVREPHYILAVSSGEHHIVIVGQRDITSMTNADDALTQRLDREAHIAVSKEYDGFHLAVGADFLTLLLTRPDRGFDARPAARAAGAGPPLFADAVRLGHGVILAVVVSPRAAGGYACEFHLLAAGEEHAPLRADLSPPELACRCGIHAVTVKTTSCGLIVSSIGWTTGDVTYTCLRVVDGEPAVVSKGRVYGCVSANASTVDEIKIGNDDQALSLLRSSMDSGPTMGLVGKHSLQHKVDGVLMLPSSGEKIKHVKNLYLHTANENSTAWLVVEKRHTWMLAVMNRELNDIIGERITLQSVPVEIWPMTGSMVAVSSREMYDDITGATAMTVYNLNTCRSVWRCGSVRVLCGSAFTPWIVLCRDRSLYVYAWRDNSMEDQSHTEVLVRAGQTARSACVLPSKRIVALFDRSVRVYSLPGGTESRCIWEAPSDHCIGAVVCPQDYRIGRDVCCFSRRNGLLYLCSVAADTSAVEGITELMTHPFTSVTMKMVGYSLVVTAPSGAIIELDIESEVNSGASFPIENMWPRAGAGP